ncbi:MAG TPA: ABC transporter permease, partial [Acidimicrobiales bacterium]|nr:ABC transporter permease [Acidimicrobiales bacterium]
MFRTTLRNLAARKLRLLTTSVAVVLGVAFMAGTLVLTDTIGRSFDDLFADVNAGTDAYVRVESEVTGRMGDLRGRLDEALVDTVASIDGVQAAQARIQGYAQILDDHGEPIGDTSGMGAPTYGTSWIQDDELNPFDLAAGRAPARDGEMVIDRGAAELGSYAVGDTVGVLTQTGRHDFTIVGIATFGGTDSPAGATFAMFTEDVAQTVVTEPGKVDGIAVIAADGVEPAELVDRIAAALPPGVEAITGDELTAEEQHDLQEGLSFFNTFLLAFAGIALFVGSFIIYNTFSIL